MYQSITVICCICGIVCNDISINTTIYFAGELQYTHKSKNFSEHILAYTRVNTHITCKLRNLERPVACVSQEQHKIKRTRRSFGRAPFTRSPKRDRQLFLNEMKRSNNPLRACEAASISWSTYQEYVATGFITQQALDEATAVFKSRHPHLDLLARNRPDNVPLGGIVPSDLPALSFDDLVLNDPEGWYTVGGENDDM